MEKIIELIYAGINGQLGRADVQKNIQTIITQNDMNRFECFNDESDNKNIVLNIEDIFILKDGRVVVTGRSMQNIRKGDFLDLEDSNGEYVDSIFVLGIEHNRKLVENVPKGFDVGLLIDADPNEVKKGYRLISEDQDIEEYND